MDRKYLTMKISHNGCSKVGLIVRLFVCLFVCLFGWLVLPHSVVSTSLFWDCRLYILRVYSRLTWKPPIEARERRFLYLYL